MPVEDYSDFLLSNSASSPRSIHPEREHVTALWQIFLENVNPLTMLIHPSSFQRILNEAMAAKFENLPLGLEALLFVIYSAAVYSTDNQECVFKLGVPKQILLTRYRGAARMALIRARFMTTMELIVLQAFTLYLVTMREFTESRTTWILAGVAARIGQGLGIHRDGTSLGLSPFAIQMRRRLWWQIAILNTHSAELVGLRNEFGIADVQVPDNIEDTSIWPEMTILPAPQARATESIMCLLRYELIAFWRIKQGENSSMLSDFAPLSHSWTSALKESDALVDELERRIEEKFLRFCSPANPLQLLASIVGRSAICTFRLKVHHPRNYPQGTSVPDAERGLLWDLCINSLEIDNFAHSAVQLRNFMWHSNFYFQWQAIIYLLGELRTHTIGPKVDHAWQQVEEAFRHHANFITDQRKPLHVAVGSLCVKAFGAREAALRAVAYDSTLASIPDYIRQLRAQRQGDGCSLATTAPLPTSMGTLAGSISENAQPESVSTPGNSRLLLLEASAGVPQQYAIPTRLDETIENSLDWAFADGPALEDIPLNWDQWDSVISGSSPLLF